MRPAIAVTLALSVALALWTYMAAADQDRAREVDTSSNRVFVDALHVGDEIRMPTFSEPDEAGVHISVLNNQESNELSLTPEEMKELSALRNEATRDAVNKRQELERKAQEHPAKVFEVGSNYIAYRLWNGTKVYLPERRIGYISRPSGEE